MSNTNGARSTLIAAVIGIAAALLAAFGIASAATGSQGDAPRNEISQYGAN
ncbi:hypothetical protein [Blastococcus sp. Marseille-P5729]|uniref:hypothetical protein n=1 Tax=Blastococcus sp. Marseille-P5729 TaxID=2086582 RepID=UPI00131E59EF|nr:hypothetical protein [Blastococcus sp. Marseille-P5729]